jgi:DNA-binding transcriptional regulator YiaG
MSEQADEWDAADVRALRERLGLTQAGLAERIGTRQQTVSEWETGTSRPRRMSRRLLHLVAEESAPFDAGAPQADGDDADPR